MMSVEMVWKMQSTNSDFLYVRFKFKYEDKVIVKMVSKDEFEELKDVFTIEFCELINWYNKIVIPKFDSLPISLNYFTPRKIELSLLLLTYNQS